MSKKYYRRICWEDGYITQPGIVIKCFDEDDMIEMTNGLYRYKDAHLYLEISSRKLYDTDNRATPYTQKIIQAYCNHCDENGKSSLLSDKDNVIKCSICGAKFRSVPI